MLWKHREDPVLCWGESLGRNLFKVFCTAHALLGEGEEDALETDIVWKAAMVASTDHYASLIVERPKEWTSFKEIPSMPCCATRGFAKHNDPLFTLTSPEGIHVSLLAGMAVSDLFACAKSLPPRKP